MCLGPPTFPNGTLGRFGSTLPGLFKVSIESLPGGENTLGWSGAWGGGALLRYVHVMGVGIWGPAYRHKCPNYLCT